MEGDELGESCPNKHTHLPCEIWTFRYNPDMAVSGINIGLHSGYQFSFQQHTTLIIDRRNRAWLYRFEPPMQVELDPIKLEQKLRTILTFS